MPRPHEVWIASDASHGSQDLMTFQVSITDTLLTMMAVTVSVVLMVLILATRGRSDVPGFFQNFAEWAHESLSSWSVGMGGPTALKYLPIFAAFFVLILGLQLERPGAGRRHPARHARAHQRPERDHRPRPRSPSSIFEYQGFRPFGVGGYLSKFFPLHEFRNGIGAGLIGLFVGLTNSSSNSSSRSRSRCDSSATSTAARSPSPSSPRSPVPSSSPSPSTAWRSSSPSCRP